MHLPRRLQIKKRVHGEGSPHTAPVLNNLAVTLRSQGRTEEAEPLLRKALDVMRHAKAWLMVPRWHSAWLCCGTITVALRTCHVASGELLLRKALDVLRQAKARLGCCRFPIYMAD